MKYCDIFICLSCLAVQLQLSEVIARSRRYFTEVTGLAAGNNILQQNATPAMFEKRFNEADILTDNPAVRKWLQQMTYDQKGYATTTTRLNQA